MKNRPARTPSQRQLRIGEEIRHAVAQMLERIEFHEPALQDVSVTVTEVRISPDLKNATAYIMPLGGDQADEVLEALTRARPFVRKQVGGTMRLRHVPNISFEMDETFDQASKVETLLSDPKVARDLAVVDDSPDDEELSGEEHEEHGA